MHSSSSNCALLMSFPVSCCGFMVQLSKRVKRRNHPRLTIMNCYDTCNHKESHDYCENRQPADDSVTCRAFAEIYLMMGLVTLEKLSLDSKLDSFHRVYLCAENVLLTNDPINQSAINFHAFLNFSTVRSDTSYTLL